MRLDELSKSWQAAAHPVTPEMSFDGDFLVLGAETRLAKAGAGLDEARLAALLTAAHGRPIAASSLRHVQRGLEKKRDGDPVLALVHLALSGVAKLHDPKEDARRLFMADALMRQGVDPAVVAKGMLSIADRALKRYSPDQPRVPAGNPDGGQWTTGDSGGNPQSVGVQVGDASATRGHQVESDAPHGSTLPVGERDTILLAQNYSQSCQAYIAANRQAKILKIFPGQFLNMSVQDVIAAAKTGDPAARRACKLLFDNRWAK